MATIDFLTFPVGSIRRSIKDIDDSYRNPWDIYAELTQNAVDAIRKMQKDHPDECGKITLEINAQDRSIKIEDNGCGMSEDEIPCLLQLFSSGKSDDSDSVGEKGVGLKFAYFQSTFFELNSSNGTSGGKAVIQDARLWKQSSSSELLKMDFESTSNQERGTSIFLKDIKINDDEYDSDNSVFTLTFDQLKYVLRSATYLGDTSTIWTPSPSPISITIRYIDFNGDKYEEALGNTYILPTEIFAPTEIIDYDDFENWLSQRDRSDTEKRQKLHGKIIVKKGMFNHRDYRRIQYWACFFPSRRDWDKINERFNLLKKENEASSESATPNNPLYCVFSPGIYTATKGMPTGITIDPPASGYSGYWPNFFMIFQDDSLAFDIGRKSIHGRSQMIYQEYAKNIFNKITKYVSKYTNSTPASLPSSSMFDRDSIIEAMRSIVDLGSDKVSFLKNPSEQEASVAAVFYEMIGNGTIKDLVPIYSGYRNKYDLYAYYKEGSSQRFCIIEFKAHLKSITKDFPDATKVFSEMNYIICWDVNSSDVQELFDFGIICEETHKSTLNPESYSDAVSHTLTIPNCSPVYVIDLKKLV